MNTPKTRPRFHVYTFSVALGASGPVGYGYWIDASLSGGMLPNATLSDAELFVLLAALRKLPERSLILHHTTNLEIAKRLMGKREWYLSQTSPGFMRTTGSRCIRKDWA
jgi:hypothetical protein